MTVSENVVAMLALGGVLCIILDFLDGLHMRSGWRTTDSSERLVELRYLQVRDIGI